MSKFRFMLMGTAAVGLTAAAMSSAFAGEVERTVGMSGHVNRAISVGTNGNEGFTRHIDNYASSSRFRGTASAASESMTIGATLEMGAYINRSTGNSEAATSIASTVGMRQSNIHVTTSMGKVSLGQFWHANIGAGQMDKSGTSNVNGDGSSPLHGVRFYDTTNRTASNVTVGSMYDTGNGVPVGTGVEYATPDFNGFSASIVHNEQASVSGGFGYSADYNGTAVSFAADAAEYGANKGTGWGLGLGVELASGLNLSVGYSEDQTNDDANNGIEEIEDQKRLQVVVGYKMTGLTDLGGTNFAVQYVKAEDMDGTANNSDNLTNVTLRVEQTLTDYGTSVYGGYEHFEYDTSLGDFDEVTGGVIGLKVTF
ncbi:MAG TPA: hypothetical protein QGG18_10190 [Rhodospirillales bacterium]|nr:hypothetical protein [Rhodospirillales bacterium]